jgi:hypothetical protein
MSRYLLSALVLPLCLSAGCAASYKAVVKPAASLSVLSPELRNLTDATIETYLKANVQPTFPAVLAVAKAHTRSDDGYYGQQSRTQAGVAVLQGEEADGWQKMTDLRGKDGQPLISQVHLVSSLLVEGTPNLKALRDAAALVHAPLLLVYMQADDAEQGYNDAAIAYWSIVGLFVVPGNTVGRYSVCQSVLIDTQSGFILATAQGESKREETVLPGAVDIARDRLQKTIPMQAVARLQEMTRKTLLDLAGAPKSAQAR